MSERVRRALARVTSSGSFLPEVDGLRCAAILAVLLFHAHPFVFGPPPRPFWEGDGRVLSYVVHQGWFGVQLFFVISGFILALPFAEQHLGGGRPVTLGRYFLRRLTRLEPPYILSLVLILAVYLAQHRHPPGTLFAHFLAHLGYAHGLVYGDLNAPGYIALNRVTWSLEIEVQFYLLAPLLCQVFRLRPEWLRRGVLVAGIALATGLSAAWGDRPFMALSLLGHLRYFLLGFLLADVHLTDWEGAPAATGAWDLLGLAAWASLPFLLAHPLAAQLLLPLALFVAYAAAFRGRLLHRVFAQPWVAVVGGMCYTIYLYHAQILWTLYGWLQARGLAAAPGSLLALVQLLPVLLLVVAVCAGFFVAFEKPFMYARWPQALVGWWRDRTGGAA